jgi:hypothetical protein
MGPFFLRDDLHQIELNLDGIIVLRQANPSAQPVDMGVHGNARHSKGVSQNDIRCLPPYSGEGNQFLQSFWNISSESFDQFLAASLDRLGFVSIESGWPDLLLQFRQI